jgi:hypothetical protein
LNHVNGPLLKVYPSKIMAMQSFGGKRYANHRLSSLAKVRRRAEPLSDPFAWLVMPDFLHDRANSAKAVAVIVKTPAIIN